MLGVNSTLFSSATAPFLCLGWKALRRTKERVECLRPVEQSCRFIFSIVSDKMLLFHALYATRTSKLDVMGQVRNLSMMEHPKKKAGKRGKRR